MRTVVTDDDGSEWSIEVFDGDCVNALTKPVKQTFPSSTAKEIHPFSLNEFSTKVMDSGNEATSRETTKRTFDARRMAPVFIPPPDFAEKICTASATRKSYAKVEKQQPRAHPTIRTNESTLSSHHERAQPQTKHGYARAHESTQLARETSSSSSTQGTKVDEEMSLPVYSFMEYGNVPAVVYTKSESEANSLVQTLKGPLGFDLEWRVMWQPGSQERRTALVQLCDHKTILLIQVSSMKKFPRKVLEVIESADIVKTGANILNDGEKLYRDFGIRAKGLVELGTLATKADDKFHTVYNRDIVSLAKMVAMYLGKTLLKGKVRTSNWEANLSHSMVEYAANDCHCALMVYNRLQEIADTDGKTLDVSMYSCQANPRPLKPNPTTLPTPSQSINGPGLRPARMLAGPLVPHYCIPEPPRPQQLRAYKLWHLDKMPLDQMCMKLRTGDRIEPLKESTVISYVVGALQADPRLPFNIEDLKTLVLMEASSWQRHRQWITSRA